MPEIRIGSEQSVSALIAARRQQANRTPDSILLEQNGKPGPIEATGVQPESPKAIISPNAEPPANVIYFRNFSPGSTGAIIDKRG